LPHGRYNDGSSESLVVGAKGSLATVFKVFRGCDKELGREIVKVTRRMPGVSQGAAWDGSSDRCGSRSGR